MTKQDPNRFYVYAYLRSKDSEHGKRLTPYYIGKGQGNRAFSASGRGASRSKGRRAPTPKDKNYIAFIQEGLTEPEAFALEIYSIALYGRIDIGTGILRNMTDGGEGGSGISEETRKRRGAARAGKKMSEETRQKMSAARKGKKMSEETRQKMSAVWLTGRVCTESTRQKISMANKGKIRSEEVRRAISAQQRKRWYKFRSPCGHYYITNHLAEFCKQHNLNRGHLSGVARGAEIHHKGWTGTIVEQLR
jgi:hypothetical protein